MLTVFQIPFIRAKTKIYSKITAAIMYSSSFCIDLNVEEESYSPPHYTIKKTITILATVMVLFQQLIVLLLNNPEHISIATAS